MNIQFAGKGLVADKKDYRDYQSKLVMRATLLPKEFSLRERISKIKDQNGSGSCVGQAFAYYAEVLNSMEMGTPIQMSARDIYSLIFLPDLPGGGAYLRDGAIKLVNSGVCLESDAPSYDNGFPPSESFMESRAGITKEAVERGMAHWAKSYVRVPATDFEGVKQAIYQNSGCVLGAFGNNDAWTKPGGIVALPGVTSWSHALYCSGFRTRPFTSAPNTIYPAADFIEFVNSWGEDWGEKGFGYLPKEYFERNLILNPWTVMDLPNNTYPKLQHAALLAIEQAKKVIEQIKNLIKK